MNKIFLVLTGLLIMFSCADEPSQNEGTIGRSEEGLPLPCDMIIDTTLLNLFPLADQISKESSELDDRKGMKCNYILRGNRGRKVGQFVVMIRPKEEGFNLTYTAKRAKNTTVVEDLEFPATWRTFRNMSILRFDYGGYIVSLNMGFRTSNKDYLLDNGKKVATRIVENMKASGF